MVKVKKIRSKIGKKKKVAQDVTQAAKVKKAGVKPGVKMRTHPIKEQIARHPAFKEAVCAITDPFCYRARNAKYPDGRGGGTLAMQIRGHSTMSTGTTNYLSGSIAVFQGCLPFAQISGSTNNGTTWTLAAGYGNITGATNFTTYCNTYRIVSWGVVVRNLLPAQTAQGYIIIRKLSKAPAGGATITNANTYGSEVVTYPVYAGQEIAVVSKPSGVDSTSFQAQNFTNTVTPGWDCICIELVGGPSTVNALDVEFVYNVEMTLADSQSTLHEFIPPDAGPNQKVTQVASHIQSKVSSVVEGGIDKFGAHVLQKVETLGMDALEGIAALFI